MLKRIQKILSRLAESFGTNHFLGVFVMVIFLVFVAPILERYSGFRWLMDIALGAVLVLTILSLANQRLVALSGVVLACIGYSGQLLDLADTRPVLQAWTNGALVLFFIMASMMIFRYVLKTRRVTANTIWAALCVYIFIGLLWSFSYAILMHVNPEAFLAPEELLTGAGRLGISDFIYFSFVTLTTVGYGDITPVSEGARSLASLESVTGQVYLTVLVARLVGMHIAFANWERQAESSAAEKEA
jgi:Ion channel